MIPRPVKSPVFSFRCKRLFQKAFLIHVAVAVHGELIHRIILEVVKNLTSVSLLDQAFTGTLDLHLGSVSGRSAYAAALADHTLDEVLGKSAGLEQCQGLLAGIAAGDLNELDTGCVFTALLHALENRLGNAAGLCKALAPYGGLLIGVVGRFDLNALGAHQCTELTVGDDVICISGNSGIRSFGLLGNAGSEEDGDAAGTCLLQVAGNRAHRGDDAGDVLLEYLGEVLALHIDECRAAGSCHLLAFVSSFRPLKGLIGSGHIAAETYLDHICKSHLKESILDGKHGNIRAELSFCSRSDHGNDLIAGLDVADDVDQIGLGSDRAEGAGVDAVTALDALGLIDVADAELIILKGADRAGTLAGTYQMCDRAVRAGICAHAALFTLGRIDPGPVIADRDRTETAGVDAGFTHTQAAVVCHGIGCQRTLLTCRTDNLDNILGIAVRIRILCQGKADSLLGNFSFLVNTASISCNGSRTDLQRELFEGLFIDIVLPCKSGHFFHNTMFKSN